MKKTIKFTEVTIVSKVTEIEIPYSVARNSIKWKSATGPKHVCYLVNNHIENIISSLKYVDQTGKYGDYTYKQWIEIFKTELKYRKVIRQYNSLTSVK